MSFNFPASPSNGQTYTPVGGPVFTWDGTAWKALSQGMPVTVFVGDVAPTAPAFGNLWWESDTGNLFIYYNDGDSAQWVQINGTPAGYQTADTRNRIVNGAFQISQENGDVASSAANYFIADQWNSAYSGITGVISWSHQSGQINYASRIRASVTTAQASISNGFSLLQQRIEGTRVADFQWGNAAAKPAVLRLICNTNLPGTYTVVLRNAPTATNVFLGSFTIAAGEVSAWVEKSIPVPAPPGGVWVSDNTAAIDFYLTLATGTTQVGVPGWQGSGVLAVPGQVNFLSTVGNAFYLAAVGLYLDPDNTGVAPKWQMPDEAEELRACQRYYQTVYDPDPGTLWFGGASGTAHGQAYNIPVVMRTQPAFAAKSGSARIYDQCSYSSSAATATYHYTRVTTLSTPGAYRAYGQTTEFNARM